MLESVVAVLREACREVVVVGQPRQLELEATFMADGFPRLGPLAGLVTGLEAICQPWALAVACDMPLLRSTALRRLLDAREDGFDAVVPVVGAVRNLCTRSTRALPEGSSAISGTGVS
jgi:molybdopterin-guanine dinucleotide biosynthesis protein A